MCAILSWNLSTGIAVYFSRGGVCQGDRLAVSCEAAAAEEGGAAAFAAAAAARGCPKPRSHRRRSRPFAATVLLSLRTFFLRRNCSRCSQHALCASLFLLRSWCFTTPGVEWWCAVWARLDRGMLILVVQWRAAVDGAVEARNRAADLERKRRLAAGGTKGEDVSYYSTVFTQRLQLWTDDAKMRQLMLDPAIGKMAAELAGVDGIRIWHDQALIKEPWASPTGFHLDNPYWSYSNRAALSLWVALDDATQQNGALIFCPGTHHTAEHSRNSGIGQVSTAQLYSICS